MALWSLVYHVHILWYTALAMLVVNVCVCFKIRVAWLGLTRLVIAYDERQRAKENEGRQLNALLNPATAAQIEDNGAPCAFCLDDLDAGGAVTLPCNHVFHKQCVTAWVSRHKDCPTCREKLLPTAQPLLPTQPRPGVVGWLASVLTNSRGFGFGFGPAGLPPLPADELEAMVAQVQQIFPHVEASMLSADLQLTRSVQITSENIVEGRLGPLP